MVLSMFYLNGWCWPIFKAAESPFPPKLPPQVDNNIDHPTIELSHPHISPYLRYLPGLFPGY